MYYFSKLFWFTLSLFIVHQIVQYNGFSIPWLHSYLDDILAPPVVLGFTLAVQQQATYRNPNYVFNIFHIVVFVVWYSVLFELIFPLQFSNETADPWDLLAYAIGGVLFFKFGNKPVGHLIKF